ncbi:hypothetical protein QQ054_37660 [Oscillatoria amoena NRMC-F 0135]|nr:hypothetical protein [Oscillatoria amoena NRMC-F 0135]
MANPNDPHATDTLPHFIRRYVRFGDKVEPIGEDDKALLVRSAQGARTSPEILYTRIGPVLTSRQKADPTDWFVVAYVQGTGELKSIFLSADAVRQHFYHASGQGRRTSLYEILSTDENTNLAGLRLAWRVKTVGASLSGDGGLKAKAERAFNLLANPDVRSAYVASLHDDEVPLPFPYGASGECVVAGRLSNDGTAFLADAILAFKPNVQPKRIDALLRQCEFLSDRIIFKDSKRKVEIWLDAGLLEGLRWDSTWNNWKQWLRSRIAITSDFVEVPTDHFEDGERLVTSWWIALPSRISVTMPASLSEDVKRARAFHDLLGRHAEILAKVREQVALEPVEAGTVQFWFDELDAAPALRPEFAIWQPDYDEFYFDQLRQRSRVWFLFREEYLFVLPGAVVSEIPMAGHASYIFAEPPDMDRFLRRYSGVVRTDIRMNKDGVSTELGFVGRVLRGTKKKRWLADVLKHSTTGKENEYGRNTDE